MALSRLHYARLWRKKKDSRRGYFFLALWMEQDAEWFCLCTKVPGQPQGKGWAQHWFQKPFREVPDFIKEHSDKNLYFCPHGYRERSRKLGSEVLCNLAWADLDEASPHGLVPEPTYAWETSPGRYSAIWKVDGLVPSALNQRITYHVKADKGGWQYGKVLKVPGTVNYKYPQKPLASMLWDDGPEHSLTTLDTTIPQMAAPAEEVELPGWCERELVKEDISQAEDRSKVLHKLVATMHEHGMTPLAIMDRVRGTVWNKFAKPEQLRIDIDRTIKKLKDKNKSLPQVEDDEEFNLITWTGVIDDVKGRRINWLWYPYLARGELTMLESDPGLSKSWVAMAVCVAFCNGGRLPMPSLREKWSKPEAVLYFDLENKPDTVIRPRLDWLGYTNNRTFNYSQKSFSLNNPKHMDMVKQQLDRIQPLVVVLDPLSKFLGDTRESSTAAVAATMSKFTRLLEEYNISGISVRHLSKAKHPDAIRGGSGNMAFAGEARIIMRVHLRKDGGGLLLLPVKNNLVIRSDFKAVEYDIVQPDQTVVMTETGIRLPEDGARFIWGGLLDKTADEVLEEDQPKEEDKRWNQEALAFLKEELRGGAKRDLQEILMRAEGQNFSEAMLRRAAKHLNVQTRTTGFGKQRKALWWL